MKNSAVIENPFIQKLLQPSLSHSLTRNDSAASQEYEIGEL